MEQQTSKVDITRITRRATTQTKTRTAETMVKEACWTTATITITIHSIRPTPMPGPEVIAMVRTTVPHLPTTRQQGKVPDPTSNTVATRL